jgi:tRNA(Ile)-lysidine synthase TilS/MesJ
VFILEKNTYITYNRIKLITKFCATNNSGGVGGSMEFYEAYKKIEEFIETNNMIPSSKRKIIIAYSGGKDASVMCDLLLEYKKRNRPNLEIELIVACFPNFLYDTTDFARRSLVNEAFNYWESKGVTVKKLNVEDFKGNILEVENPCSLCARIKTELMGNYVRLKTNNNSVFCLGLNLDDSIGWFLEIYLLASLYGEWQNIKKQNPVLYKEILILSVRVISKLCDEKNNILFIRPMMLFSSKTIKRIAIERKLPLIPEDCREITKKDVFYDSPRRDLINAIESMRNKYTYENILYNNYYKLLQAIEKCKCFPPVSELNDFMEKSLLV